MYIYTKKDVLLFIYLKCIKIVKNYFRIQTNIRYLICYGTLCLLNRFIAKVSKGLPLIKTAKLLNKEAEICINSIGGDDKTFGFIRRLQIIILDMNKHRHLLIH